MPTHRLTAFAAAPPDRVFDLWTDLDRMKEWVGGVTKVTDVTGPVDRVGTRYVVWFAEGWVSAITSRLFALGSYKGSYQGELNGFAKLAEGEAAPKG